MKTIDTGITEADLFEQIMAEGEIPMYDPALHLDPRTAAKRWNVHWKTAQQKLSNDPRLKVVKVRSPQTGKEFTAFVPAEK